VNTGEKIALLQEELKSEDERQEVLYAKFRKHCDLWSDELEKNLSSDDRQELVILTSPIRKS
jgi:hypothetical protein